MASLCTSSYGRFILLRSFRSAYRILEGANLATDERGALAIEDSTAASGECVGAARNPEQTEDGERKRGPVNETRVSLVIEDGEERPGNGRTARDVTLSIAVCVASTGALEQEKRQEGQNLGRDSSGMRGADAERLERTEEYYERRPAAPQAKGQVNPKFIIQALGSVANFDSNISVTDRRADEEGKDECGDRVTAAPETNIDRVERSDQRKSPPDAVNYNALARREELVND